MRSLLNHGRKTNAVWMRRLERASPMAVELEALYFPKDMHKGAIPVFDRLSSTSLSRWLEHRRDNGPWVCDIIATYLKGEVTESGLRCNALELLVGHCFSRLEYLDGGQFVGTCYNLFVDWRY